MKMVKRAIAIAAVSVGVLGLGVGTASAHNAVVSTPSGQENCQFMGGPGNPNHAGHGNGHPEARDSEQSGSFSVQGGECPPE